MVITSRQHEVVRTYRRVARGDRTLALIDGWHLLQEAVSAGMPVVEIATARVDLPPAIQSLLAGAARGGTRLVDVSSNVMEAMSPVRTPSGVVALVQRRETSWSAWRSSSTPLVLVAVGLQDPGNAGALVRASEAGGASAVVLAGEAADPWSWKALRASMGSTFRMPVVRDTDVARTFRTLRGEGLRLVATAPRAAQSMYECDLRAPTAIVLGAEGAGLDRVWLDEADATMRIPMRAPVESLNVAVAAALAVYEATRQRKGTREAQPR